YERGEYAVLVRSDLKGRGIGWGLMELMIRYARSEGLREIDGQVLRENTMMLRMCRELGFEIAHDPNDSTIEVVSLLLGAADRPGESVPANPRDGHARHSSRV